MIDFTELQDYTGHYALLIFVLLLCSHFDLRFTLGKGRSYGLSLPPGPWGWPLVGNIFQMNKDQEWIQYFAWSRIYGELVSVNVMGKRILFLNSVKAVHEILDRQADATTDRPEMLMMNLTGWGFNFGFLSGERWRARSRMFHEVRTLPL